MNMPNSETLAPPNANQAAPQAPTIDQLLAEGHGRLRRMLNDQVYIGNLLDTLVQEIVGREKALQELRHELVTLKAGD